MCRRAACHKSGPGLGRPVKRPCRLVRRLKSTALVDGSGRRLRLTASVDGFGRRLSVAASVAVARILPARRTHDHAIRPPHADLSARSYGQSRVIYGFAPSLPACGEYLSAEKSGRISGTNGCAFFIPAPAFVVENWRRIVLRFPQHTEAVSRLNIGKHSKTVLFKK